MGTSRAFRLEWKPPWGSKTARTNLQQGHPVTLSIEASLDMEIRVISTREVMYHLKTKTQISEETNQTVIQKQHIKLEIITSMLQVTGWGNKATIWVILGR